MADEDSLVIELDAPETAEKPVQIQEPVKAPDGATKPEPTSKPLPDALEELRQQHEQLKQARETDQGTLARLRAEAEESSRRAAAAEAEVTKARGQLTESNTVALETGIEAARTEADAAAREQQSAFEAGDFAKAAEAGRRMARAEARVARLEESKADLEIRAKQEKPETPAPAQSASADAFERAIAQTPPRAQAWLRAHPTYVTDQKLNWKANAAHALALSEGIMPETDAYFEFCERQLGLKTDAPKEEPKQEQQQPRTKAMPGAPVSRETTPSGGALTPTQVTLSRGEQMAANDGTIVWERDDPKGAYKRGDPIGNKEYARRKLAMEREGRYDRSYTEN